jgi:hypothetical protein
MLPAVTATQSTYRITEQSTNDSGVARSSGLKEMNLIGHEPCHKTFFLLLNGNFMLSNTKLNGKQFSERHIL